MAIWQEWAGRRFEMMAEDGKHLFADTQKFMETGTSLVSSRLPTKHGGGST
jgi:hypothetical protein